MGTAQGSCRDYLPHAVDAHQGAPMNARKSDWVESRLEIGQRCPDQVCRARDVQFSVVGGGLDSFHLRGRHQDESVPRANRESFDHTGAIRALARAHMIQQGGQPPR